MREALAALEAEIARDLAYIDFPPKDWVRPRTHPSGRPVIDVVIEGAGMQGLAIAFALRRARIGNILARPMPEAQNAPAHHGEFVLDPSLLLPLHHQQQIEFG